MREKKERKVEEGAQREKGKKKKRQKLETL